MTNIEYWYLLILWDPMRRRKIKRVGGGGPGEGEESGRRFEIYHGLLNKESVVWWVYATSLSSLTTTVAFQFVSSFLKLGS
jgi:hypothetical protein